MWATPAPQTHFPPMTSIVKRSASCTVSGWPCGVGTGLGSFALTQARARPPLGPSRLAPCIHSQALPQLYLGQLDGFIELVQGALEVCDLWGKAWSVLPCEDPTLLPPTWCSLAIRQP